MSNPVGSSSGSAGVFGGAHVYNETNGDEPSIERVQAREGSAITKLSEPLTENNWMGWQQRMRRVLRLCGILAYAEGKVPIPEDPKGAKNWEFNDNYAQVMIINNITQDETVHVSQCLTAKAMWDSLEAIHETKGHQTIVSIIRNLFHTKANEESNIGEHLNLLKKYWERINQLDESDFKISDVLFKVIISSSLPLSWDAFTESYVGGRKGVTETDPKKLMGSQQFIGILKEEYLQRQLRSDKGEIVNYVNHKRSLENRISPASGPSKYSGEPCKHCGKDNHDTIHCKHLGASRCSICGKFGHTEDRCWERDKGKRKNGRGDHDNGRSRKKKKREVNEIEEEHDSDELVSMNIEGTYTLAQGSPRKGGTSPPSFEEDDEIEYYNYNGSTYNTNEIDEPVAYYDWFGDSATSSHVTNQRDIFLTYQPLRNTSVIGVGKLTAKVEGRGTIELKSRYNNKTYILRLHNVLHIPSNRNNLISLGKWDAVGGRYIGGGGKIILEDKNGNPVTAGTKIDNHLYRLNLETRKPRENLPSDRLEGLRVFNTEETLNWETWHRRFGHIGYSGIQKLVDLKMVDGLSVDTESAKPDCEICVQAKQSIKPFDGIPDRKSKPGELTHIDLWGKYDIASINGYQYYILFVDDATRYVTVHFLKKKDEAAQHVKNYIQALKTHKRSPRAIKIDRGKEFLNEVLKTFLDNEGLEIQATAPYSPSQNGIAERMNRTLVELGRAMLKGQELPEFLWEYAIAHAAYLRNRAYTKFLKNKTPYEKWNKSKPNVTHLREFGAPVWVLLQGQNVPRKMLAKSKRRAYVGFDDGSKSVLYYNAETRRVLTSRNYRFLSITDKTPPEEIVVAPDIPHEGEMDRSTLPTGGDSRKRKRGEEDVPEILGKRAKMRVDYRYLDDPYWDKEDQDATYQTFAGDPNDVPESLKEAQRSSEWSEWEKAIKIELDQLVETGTWKLVDKPKDAIPISNKFVFEKKRNKAGEIMKYKARLVAKGCSQRPGYDYQETFSPVVRMETVRAILSLVPSKKLKIQQMDVKGAYLNGILKEKVYMKQPEGYDDGTGRVCLLVKTLYGLKQSGREWNVELDKKLKQFGFSPLRSDPCAYVRRNGDNLEIITVWVDDLLLFATSDELINKMKSEIQSEWTVTDMGDPQKIIGIEITKSDDSLIISQQKYVENILRRERMLDANPVSMPMDPNIPIGPNPDGNEGSRSNAYAKLLGELQFLSNATRPDISYAVNRLAAYTANPSLQHVGAIKRLLRYLKGTRNLGIKYSVQRDQNLQDQNLFFGYADAAYANTDDYKSTSGYVFVVNNGAITWRSKKQTTIALSSTESEYIALSEAGREACWLRNLYEVLGYTQKLPNILKGDNDGSIAMARNPQFHKRSKHIATRWHWVRDLVQNRIITIESCRDPEQTADVLTKPLARPKHQKHVSEMGMVTI